MAFQGPHMSMEPATVPDACQELRPSHAYQNGRPSPPLWIPAFAGMTNVGRNDECRGRGMRAHPRARNTIFVPSTHAGWRRDTKGA